MRPAVFSAYSSSSPTSAPAGRLWNQFENRGRQLLGQVVNDGRRVVRRQLLQQLDDLVGGAIGEQCGARFRTELAQRLHREPAVPLDEEGERRVTILLGELGKELREVGRMLLLEKVDEIRRRPHAHEALYGVEHDVELALRHEQST